MVRGVREECVGWVVYEGGGVIGRISIYTKKKKKKKLFVSFLGVVGTVLDGCDIH
jgi:hypothetical protein